MMAHYANEIAKSQLSVVIRQPFRWYDYPLFALDQRKTRGIPPQLLRPVVADDPCGASVARSCRIYSSALKISPTISHQPMRAKVRPELRAIAISAIRR
jgi:hypothetical protein